MQIASQSTSAKSPQPVRVFKYDPQALALLGIRTSVVVATILSAPDAVALIPGSKTLTSWVINLVGCWTTALVLWFVFFVGLLHVIRFLAGGVEVKERGVRLWRFGKLIRFESIKSVAVEREGFFSRVFSYEQQVKRLTIFTQNSTGPSFLRGLVIPHYVPSFFFARKDFDALCKMIARRTFATDASPAGVILAEPGFLPALRSTYRVIRWQRIVVSLLVTVGIGGFLARKAIVLYSYNEGLKEYRLSHFDKAVERFNTAVIVEPTFSPAWHGLAGSEFNMGNFNEAREHWTRALVWKPDYVEAKVSLGYMSLQQRDFAEAEKMINSALSLAPSNSTALVNRADLNLRTGHIREAVRDARLVISQQSSAPSRETFMANCILAQAKLLQNKPQEALELLAPLPMSEAKLSNGENLTYRLLVGAQTFLALGQTGKAERLCRLALQRSQNVDSLIVMAQICLAKKEFDVAERILERCRGMMPHNPWVYLAAARVNLAQNNQTAAAENLKSAEQCRPLDALSLAQLSTLYYEVGNTEKAMRAARLARAMEPYTVLSGPVAEALQKYRRAHDSK